MFTGIIQGIGEVEKLVAKGDKARIRVHVGPWAEEVEKGHSVSVSGVCLTAVEIGPGWIEFDAITTTLSQTTLKALSRGRKVNLERALRFGDPLGGHLVYGHVDGVGKIQRIDKHPGEIRFSVKAPDEVMRYLVERGSVALDGISLTVAKLLKGAFEVAVIPYTLSETTLEWAKAGDRVNLEGDMIGRWVEKYLDKTEGSRGLSPKKLQEEGYMGDPSSWPGEGKR